MSLFLHSMSRTVHNYHEHQEENNQRLDHDRDHKNNEDHPCTSLTVWRKSLLFNCSGFAVFGSDGNLHYRVDNYIERPDEIVLMDGSGDPIFTICRGKKSWLTESWWHVYEGEMNRQHGNKTEKHPIFRARKTTKSIIGTNKANNLLAFVYYCEMLDNKMCCRRYTIEGSYTSRSCKMLDDDSRRVIAEIKKKEEAKEDVCFGLEVFDLIVKPGFEPRFAVVSVVLLDRMFHR